MKNFGIWIDKDKAHIVKLNNDTEEFSTIESDIDNFHITSNKSIGGAKEVAIDRKYLERENHQIKSFFKDVATEINDANAIVIFGPAQMREKFKKELDENYKTISSKVKGVIKTNKMSDNQMKAWVKDYFKSN